MNITSPFKFLDSYRKEDGHLFFGREREVEEIYSRIFESQILLIYGASGTGKSSIVQCGLANKFQDADWLPVSIRRGQNINHSFNRELEKLLLTPVKKKKDPTRQLLSTLKSLYLDYFKPVYLIFDQFEELFIFGTKEEWDTFVESIKQISESELKAKFIFIIRGEYLQYISEFEHIIPDFLDNRFRIEKMTRNHARNCIAGPCKATGITFDEDFPEKLLTKLNQEKSEVELTYLQVFLDKIFKTALSKSENEKIHFANQLLKDLGNVGDVLSEFLDEQIDALPEPEKALTLLKAFVSSDGTKKQITLEETTEFTGVLGRPLAEDEAGKIIQELINRRILQDKDEAGRFELRHDSLAAKIYHKITQYERDLIEVKNFLDYGYNEHQKRGFLLNESDLNYINPFLDKITLNQEIQDFVKKSQKVVDKKKRTRAQLYIVGTVISALLLISIGLLLYSFEQKAKADEMALLALQESEEAKKQEEVALQQKALADQQRLLALEQEKLALKQSEMADSSARMAIAQRERARQLQIMAENNAHAATSAREEAEKNALLANQNAEKAALSQQEAEAQKVLAEKYRMIALAKSLAVKTSLVFDPELKTLMALQAYNFNEQYQGYEYDADIYLGMLDAGRSNGLIHPARKDHTGRVTGMIAYKTGVITSGSDGEVFFIDNGTRTTLFSSEEIINDIDLDTEKDILAIATSEGKLVLLNMVNSTIVQQKNISESGIYQLSLVPQSNNLIISTKNNQLELWDYQSMKSTKIAKTSDRVICQTLLPKNEGVIVGLANGEVREYLFETNFISLSNNETATASSALLGRKLFSEQDSGPRIKITAVNIDNNRNIIAAGDEAGNLYLLEEEILRVNKIHTSRISSISFSDDGKFMLTTGYDGVSKFWNFEDIYQVPVTISIFNSWVVAGTFNTETNWFFTGEQNGEVNLFPNTWEFFTEQYCTWLSRGFTESEWNDHIGNDIPVQTVCEQKISVK